jgi:hypothetical protein
LVGGYSTVGAANPKVLGRLLFRKLRKKVRIILFEFISRKTIKDRHCAEVNRQKIEGESPLSGKA